MLAPLILITLSSCFRAKPSTSTGANASSFVYSGPSDIPDLNSNAANGLVTDGSDQPIKVSEANWLFTDALKFMDQADGTDFSAKAFFKGDQSSFISRAEFIGALAILEDTQHDFYLQVVRDQYMDPSVIKLPAAEKKLAERLILRGFLAPTSPLVVGRRSQPTDDVKSVSLSDAGDAVGYLISRWAQQTHHSSLKWSPDLQYLNH